MDDYYITYNYGCSTIPTQELCDKRATVSDVCRAWRNVVLSNPQYWMNILLQLCTKPSYTEFCVAKAGVGPIALKIDLDWYEQDPHWRSELFRRRCMTPSHFLTSTLPLVWEVYPRVESLHIGASDECDVVAVMAVLSRYGRDSIRSTTYTAVDTHANAVCTAIGVRRQHATESVMMAELVKLLHACEALRVLEYEFDESAEVVTAMVFPALQELCVEAGPCASIEALTITAPAGSGSLQTCRV
ncbi:hypothetical protein C8R43DRAFT_945686 [Mycena crocata]|nr:hypothetical protein C8R43DRAFT_945686 [Mycena crocata]